MVVVFGMLVWVVEICVVVCCCCCSYFVVCLVVVFVVGFLVFWVVGGVCIFLFSIVGLVFLILVYVLLCLCNFKNKIENKIESIGFKWMLMGLLLEVLG